MHATNTVHINCFFLNSGIISSCRLTATLLLRIYSCLHAVMLRTYSTTDRGKYNYSWKEDNIMAHQIKYFSLVFLLSSLNLAASEVYHIRTNSTSHKLRTAPCVTLSEFTTNFSYRYFNTTLVFLPGIHYLTVNLSISNADNVFMTSEGISA